MIGFVTVRKKKLAPLGNEKGFTLIELLVVVIIIGVLAAIAIPVYIGVQNNAKDSAAKSDLSNAKLAVVAYYASNPLASVFPVLTTLGNYGYKGTTVVANTGTGTAGLANFCLKSNNGNTVLYITHDTAATSVKAANCT